MLRRRRTASSWGGISEPLADLFVEAVGVRPGQRALDVGCGPGALTARLADRLGAGKVAAVDPSAPFVAAARQRLPGADVRQGVAEQLPFPDGSVDVALAQLVVHFMADPVAGLVEMARVTRTGGVVAASVWDYGGGPARSARSGPRSGPRPGERGRGPAGRHLGGPPGRAVCRGRAGGRAAPAHRHRPYASFEEWWHPYTLGVGPAGDHVRGLDEPATEALKARCRERLPDAPFEISASAWCVTATV